MVLVGQSNRKMSRYLRSTRGEQASIILKRDGAKCTTKSLAFFTRCNLKYGARH